MKKVITASNYEVIPLNLRTNVRFYTSVDFGAMCRLTGTTPLKFSIYRRAN